MSLYDEYLSDKNKQAQKSLVQGVNQGLQSAMPRLNNVLNSQTRQTFFNKQNQPQNTNNNTNASTSINSLFNGAASLMNGINSIKSKNDDMGNYTSGAVSNAINSYINNDNESSKANDIFSTAGDLYGLYSVLGNSGGSAMGGYGGIISGGINGLGSFAQSGDYKDGIQGFFGQNKNDSDVMQAIKGTVNGATTGGSFGGPWGALIGGIAGLGSSFLDDI
jgi:hypothetical protein